MRELGVSEVECLTIAVDLGRKARKLTNKIHLICIVNAQLNILWDEVPCHGHSKQDRNVVTSQACPGKSVVR